MDITGAFPSDYLRGLDLQGREVTVVISHVVVEQLGGEPKPIIYFQGKDKGMVLNKTNANVISHVYNEETENWKGRQIVIFNDPNVQ